MSSVLEQRVHCQPVVSRDDQPLRGRAVRVCFLIDSLSRAGTETQLLALIRELDRARVEPSLVLLDGEDELSRSLEPANCPVLRLGLKRLVGVRSIGAARRLRAFWREQGTDILQAYFLDSAYFGVPLARWSGVKRIIRVRNNLGYWLTRKHRLLNRLIGQFVNVTLTNTDAGKQTLIDTEGMSPKKVAVLANGVDLARFSGFSVPDPGKSLVRIGCVANLRPVKNIDGLMRTARQLCDQYPNVVFEVAGDGEQRAELERLHTELRLGDRFVLRGSVSDVPGFLRTLDMAVLPSHSEGMSNALLEYMAAGRAIVATAVGANSSLIANGESGLIVPPKQEIALAEAISQLMSDPALAARLGAAARTRVEADFSREAMRQRFENFYHDLLGD